MRKWKILIALIFLSSIVLTSEPGSPDPWYIIKIRIGESSLPPGVVFVVDERPSYNYYALRNDESTPFYLAYPAAAYFDTEYIAEMYPNSELPPKVIPKYKIVSSEAYYYDSFEKRWARNSGGINGRATYEVQIEPYLITEMIGLEIKQIYADDRPASVEVSEPQNFSFVAYYGDGEQVNITGTIVYELNEKYDPKRFQKNLEALHNYESSQYFPQYIVIPLIVFLFVICLAYFLFKKRIQRKSTKNILADNLKQYKNRAL